MNGFYKRFLLEDLGRLSPGSGRHASLGAFGKHPGWDDHVEDLGLETESLIFAKTLLYVEGIGGQIDAGAWEKLDPAQQIPAFKHLFVWCRGDQVLVGRLWSSSDGKGRTRYPMVICAHFGGVSLGWAMDQALPRMKEIEEDCLQSRAAADVRATLDRYRRELRASLGASSPSAADEGPSRGMLVRFGASPEVGMGEEQVSRVLYQVQSHMTTFAPGGAAAKADASGPRAQQIRLPKLSEDLKESVLLWRRFFLAQLDASTPLLFTWPLEGDWVDVTLGEPAVEELFCLRANTKKFPLASEVPYNLDDDFKAWVGAFLTSFQGGVNRVAPYVRGAAKPSGASSDGAAAGRSKWKWFGVAGGVLAVGIVAAMLFSPSKPPAPATSTTAANADKGMTVAKSEAAPQASAQAEEKARVEAKRLEEQRQAQAKRLLEEKQKLEAAEKARLDAQNRERERLAAEEKVRIEAAEKSRLDAEAKIKREAEARLREQQLVEAKKKREAEENLRLETEARLKQEAEARQRELQLAQEKQRREAEEKLRLATATAATPPAVAPATTTTPPPAAKPPTTVTAPTTVPTTTTPTVAPPATTPPAGQRAVITNSIGMVLVKSFDDMWVGRFEVTQAEYEKVMSSNPSRFKSARNPVETVSWDEAMTFCQKLSALEKQANKLPANGLYVLPSQKRWVEMLADAQFADGVTRLKDASRASTSEVGSTGKPNRYGLYDMYGNVWEWCSDDETPAKRTLRGGAFNATTLSGAGAYTTTPDFKASSMGFRCVFLVR